MAFATPLDLLARSNAQKLMQLAVPADMEMPPLESFRVFLEGGDVSALADEDQAALDAALVAINQALADAGALIVSYGIPETVQTTLLARLCSTIALYYLYGEQCTEDLQRNYNAVVDTLKQHARGMVSLIPIDPLAVADSSGAEISSNPPRYGYVPIGTAFDLP